MQHDVRTPHKAERTQVERQHRSPWTEPLPARMDVPRAQQNRMQTCASLVDRYRCDVAELHVLEPAQRGRDRVRLSCRAHDVRAQLVDVHGGEGSRSSPDVVREVLLQLGTRHSHSTLHDAHVRSVARTARWWHASSIVHPYAFRMCGMV
eukprot:3823784-Rhodomonas_salina.1